MNPCKTYERVRSISNMQQACADSKKHIMEGGGSMAYGGPGPAQGVVERADWKKLFFLCMSGHRGPPLAMQGQFMPNVSRPQMTSLGLGESH